MELPDRFLSGEAVFFFDGNEVIKQMLYLEFEAVLDGVVGIPEFSGRHYKAAYAAIECILSVHSIVLFEIAFDDEGKVPESWNVPLRQLAKEGVPGPDFGEGSIDLMTRRLCTDTYYKPMLWEPHGRQKECLKRVYEAVKENRLGLYSGEERRRKEPQQYDDKTPLSELYSGSAGLGSDQRQDMVDNIQSTLSYKYKKSIGKLKDEHRKAAIDLERQYREQLEIVSEKYRVKFERELDRAREDFAEQLDVKQLELHYSQENERQLQQEFEKIEVSIRDAQDQFLGQLVDVGIELIVSHSGSGTYSLKTHQVKEYLGNPIGFWARQQGVSEIQYKAWHKHYQNPVCQMGASTDCPCGKKLERVNNPAGFVIGETDICASHRRAKG